MSVSRVRYRERQILRQLDLLEEQAYQLEMRRRHHIGHHGWGIVQGLALQGGEQLLIEPGLAVDGYGRFLVLPALIEVNATILDNTELCGEQYPKEIDVWLLYAREPGRSKQNGRYDPTVQQHDRWHDEARVRLELADDELVEPRRPAAVAVVDRDFGPHRQPPDDPDNEWPIYLGRIRRTAGSVDLIASERPFATLYGAAVNSPSGRAQIMVENELAGSRHTFAIRTQNDKNELQDRLTIRPNGETTINGKLTLHHTLSLFQVADFEGGHFLKELWCSQNQDHDNCQTYDKTNDTLTSNLYRMMREEFKNELVQNNGAEPTDSLLESLIEEMNWILQNCIIEGHEVNRITDAPEDEKYILANRHLLEQSYPEHISLHRKLLHIGESLIFDTLTSPPEVAMPWKTYHTTNSTDKENQEMPNHQLRVEIAHPGKEGDSMRYKLSIGHSDMVNTFSPCLIVRADGNVIVNGDIDLDGELVEGPIPADPNDPRFANALLDNWLGGISSAAGTIDAHYSSPIELSFVTLDPSPLTAGGQFDYSVAIKNAGQTELKNINVQEILSIPNGIPIQTNVESIDAIAGAKTEIVAQTSSVPNAPGATLTIVVTVIAIGPDGSQVQATITENRGIAASIPEIF